MAGRAAAGSQRAAIAQAFRAQARPSPAPSSHRACTRTNAKEHEYGTTASGCCSAISAVRAHPLHHCHQGAGLSHAWPFVAATGTDTHTYCSLFELVNDPATDNIIRWDPAINVGHSAGTPFTILDNSRLEELLPKYFKHSNYLR